MKRLQTFFVTGLIVLTPAAITFYVLWWLFEFVDGILGPILARVLPFQIPGLGVLIILLVIILTGLLAANFLGRRLIAFAEGFLLRTPVVRSVYLTMRQIVDALLQQNQSAFKRVALVEYPRRGSWAIGFVTGEIIGEIAERAGCAAALNVFVPTTPNPTSGMLVFLPLEEVILLDMSVEDGLKLVISGGVIVPEHLKQDDQSTAGGGNRSSQAEGNGGETGRASDHADRASDNAGRLKG